MVLIGVDEARETLIVHSYELGNNYKISFSEFEKFQKNYSEKNKVTYIVVQPGDFEAQIEEVRKRPEPPYPPEGEVVRRSREMVRSLALGISAVHSGNHILAREYFTKATSNEGFEEWLPPVFKIFLLQRLADTLLSLGELNEAQAAVTQALALNHGLTAPFKDWPGYEIELANGVKSEGVSSEPYRIQGDIYYAQGEKEKARDAYETALSINPYNAKAKTGLARVAQ